LNGRADSGPPVFFVGREALYNAVMGRRTYTLPYGRGGLGLEADEDRFLVLDPPPAPPLSEEGLERLLTAPVSGPSLDRVVKRGEDVLVVFSDASRRTASERVLPLLLERLGKIGAGRVRAIVATGTHRPATGKELEALMGRAAGWVPVLQHDALSPDLRLCEPTSRGTEVALNPALFEADRVIATGAVTFHYHAGFTGGPKAVFPGLGGARGILRSHLRSLTWPALERHPLARPGLLEGNPVQEDLMEAASRRAPDYLVNIVADAGGRPVAGASGPPREAHRAACEAFREQAAATVPTRFPLVVVSAGGWPRDRDLVQAHKAMEHVSAALEEGGVLVFAAAIGEGPGSEGLREWLALGSPEAIRERLREVLGDRLPEGEEGPPAPAGEAPGVYAQTALLLLEKTCRYRVLLVSELPDREVEALGMEPARDLGAAVRRAEEMLGRDAPGLLVPQGAEVLPVVEETNR